MSSLPWICAVTLTLLCCLTAQPVTKKPVTKIPSYVSSMIVDFNKTIADDTCFKETENTFYSPVNVKETCVLSALDCYVKELNVFVEECGAQQAAEDLLTTLEGISKADAFCSNYICEVSPQKPFKEFLYNMISLVQQINALPLKSRR